MPHHPRIEKVDIYDTDWWLDDLERDPSTSSLIYGPGGCSTRLCAVRIYTNTGVIGEYIGGGAVASVQASTVAQHLIGRDPLQRERIYRDLSYLLRSSDKIALGPIDLALWDFAGKYYGASVSELLGGWRDTLPCYASTLTGDRQGGLDSPHAYAAFALDCKNRGYPGFKLHISSTMSHNELIATLSKVRSSVGDAMDLMLDPGAKLSTFAEAWRVGTACDEYKYLWLEDPYKSTGASIRGHLQLKALLRTPLLITEYVRGVEEHMNVMTSGATDLVRADPEWDGGITGCLRIAHAAEALGLDVEIHSPGPAQRQLMASVRNTNYYEMGLVHPLLDGVERPQAIYASNYSDSLGAVDDMGRVQVPKEEGLGVEYDWELVEGHATAHHEYN